MKPSFAMLRQNYPRLAHLDKVALHKSIGWEDVLQHAGFGDTCAIRMSIALLKSGVSLPGARMTIKAGPLKGRRIEPGQGKLTRILTQVWGQPQVFRSRQQAFSALRQSQGVVSFFQIEGADGPNQGHIDISQPSGGDYPECAMSCYFSSVEIRFWALK